MGYLDMTPPEDKETRSTHTAWMPYEMLLDKGEVIDVFINGQSIREFTDLADLKEQLLDSMKIINKITINP